MSYSYERVEITLKREDGSVLKGVINNEVPHNRCYVNIWDGLATLDGQFEVEEEKKDD